MADYITVADLRHQLNLADDEGDETFMQFQCDAAESSIIKRLNRTVYPTKEAYDEAVENGTEHGTGIVIDDSIKMGILMMAATLDQSREFNSGGIMIYKVPHTIDLIIDPYVNHGIGGDDE